MVLRVTQAINQKMRIAFPHHQNHTKKKIKEIDKVEEMITATANKAILSIDNLIGY